MIKYPKFLELNLKVIKRTIFMLVYKLNEIVTTQISEFLRIKTENVILKLL